eukprot:931571-Prymnesium_polylepis.1
MKRYPSLLDTQALRTSHAGVTASTAKTRRGRALGLLRSFFCFTAVKRASKARAAVRSLVVYKKRHFADVTSRGTLPCSSAAEASAELLEAHSRPPAACVASSWAHAAA